MNRLSPMQAISPTKVPLETVPPLFLRSLYSLRSVQLVALTCRALTTVGPNTLRQMEVSSNQSELHFGSRGYQYRLNDDELAVLCTGSTSCFPTLSYPRIISENRFPKLALSPGRPRTRRWLVFHGRSLSLTSTVPRLVAGLPLGHAPEACPHGARLVARSYPSFDVCWNPDPSYARDITLCWNKHPRVFLKFKFNFCSYSIFAFPSSP